MPPQEVPVDGGHEALLALLRTRGLSVKGLGDPKREELRAFLDCLHNTKGMSLNDIAKLVGNSESTNFYG